MERFFYDWRLAECLVLIYTGIGGNANNFLTREDCDRACKGSGRPKEDSPFSMLANQERLPGRTYSPPKTILPGFTPTK